jgi:hypothetical protein
MLNRNSSLKQLLGCAVVTGAFFAASTGAQASVIDGVSYTPLITSGALPDTPAAHVDPNNAASPFSGVVSINIRYSGQSFICSGALVGKRQVVSAGHCVDTDGNGSVINLNTPGNDVRVVFNTSGTGGTAVMTAVGVSMNPDYKGFGKCPAGVIAFCVNDDLSVITLGADAPAGAKIYKMASNPVTSGTHITMAGYGRSGNGINGYTLGPDFRIKRTGENYVDMFDGDDESGWGGANEVYYADFDGTDANGVVQDTHCTYFGVCTPALPNNRESGIGGGDSGGPSFVTMYGELMLVANNTFSQTYTINGVPQVPGTFGTTFGGILLSSYVPYLVDATDGAIRVVPEPSGIALLGMAAMMLLASRRRSRK